MADTKIPQEDGTLSVRVGAQYMARLRAIASDAHLNLTEAVRIMIRNTVAIEIKIETVDNAEIRTVDDEGEQE